MRTPDKQRKQRQRRREKSSGLVRVELLVPTTLLAGLKAHLTPIRIDVKHELAGLLRLEMPKHIERLQALAAKAGPLWSRADKYRPFASRLTNPGVTFQFRGVPYSSDEWHAIQGQLGSLMDALSKLGWPQKRIERFLKHASASQKKLSP